MIFHIVTLFPAMMQSALDHSILKRAQAAGTLQVKFYDLRSFTHDKHNVVDDSLYGGAPGMLIKAPPFFEAVEAVKADVAGRKGEAFAEKLRVVMPLPIGRVLTQRVVEELAQDEEIVILCAHYEGVDARVEENLATDIISAGDYVVTGGELPALIIVDAVSRLQSGVLHDIGSALDDSFTTGLLQEPQYTRPPDYQGMKVPDALLSGNHAELAKWRRRESLLRTLRLRPDLLAKANLTDKERAWLREQGWAG